MIGGEAVQAGPDKARRQLALSALDSLRLHWPEYLMEAGELAIYMFAVCVFATLLQHPASPVRLVIGGGVLRRALMGLAVGATVIAIILTPWGKQSGGHFNPAITLAFYRLGNVAIWDAVFYAAAQFSGAVGGVAVATYLLRGAPANEAVRYAMTLPGMQGKALAFVAEVLISSILMATILVVSNRDTLARYTPYCVGTLYAIFITIESPLSGMSMNPARTFGSASLAMYWGALWIYFIAPTLGMLVAAEVFLQRRGGAPPYCAKLHHANNKRCIFHHRGPVESHSRSDRVPLRSRRNAPRSAATGRVPMRLWLALRRFTGTESASAPGPQQKRFAAWLDGLACAVGHADRIRAVEELL